MTRTTTSNAPGSGTSISSIWKASTGSPKRSSRITQAVMVSGRIPGSVVTSETRLMSTVIGRGSLQPASLLEEREQDGAGDDQAAHPDAPEGHCGVDPLDQPSEVLSEEPGDEGQRQEDGGDDRQLLHDRVEAVGDAREVDVHRAGEHVPVGVDLLRNAGEVVPDVAEVVARSRLEPWKVLESVQLRGEDVAHRADHAP